VIDTEVGYTGGEFENPTYEDVCSGKTGHVEAVHLLFEPSQVSYEELLAVFWGCHNPTTPNRQGLDVGTQYRSAIFCYTSEQKQAAEESKRQLDQSGRYTAPVVTRILLASRFWRAEEYHQQYLEKSGMGGCHL
jgi:peptide-methionine (S)-S-oxide reductase